MEMPAQNYADSPTPYWKNGQMVGAAEAVVSVFDHGLLYGDGCFEGLRFYGGRPFRVARHLQRLRRSLQALAITIPYSDEDLNQAVADCIEHSGQDQGYLRILVTRGEGDLGLNPANCHSPSVFVLASALALVSDERRRQGISLITSSIKRAVGTGLDPRVKTLNYLHSVLARAEANAANVDEAILLNQFGHVAECSAENIFVYDGQALLTPPLRDGALGGITRETVLELAEACGIPSREQSMTTYDLYNAKECFLCGSGARLIPVRSIDGRAIAQCPGEIYQQVVAGYERLIRTN
ncbi:MAG: aminotransferase class IV [Marinobacter sp.]|nr:aminotransferase class IV [Marinobacter sp.]